MLLTAAPFDLWTVKGYVGVMGTAEPIIRIPDFTAVPSVCCSCCFIKWLDLLGSTVGMTCFSVVHLSAVQHNLVMSLLLHFYSTSLAAGLSTAI